jgi:hypothetical protein
VKNTHSISFFNFSRSPSSTPKGVSADFERKTNEKHKRNLMKKQKQNWEFSKTWNYSQLFVDKNYTIRFTVQNSIEAAYSIKKTRYLFFL